MFSVLVSCGTYDGSVFTLEYLHDTIDIAGPKLLKPLFIDPTAHPSPVTTVATKDDVVISGSSDEIIQVSSQGFKFLCICTEQSFKTIPASVLVGMHQSKERPNNCDLLFLCIVPLFSRLQSYSFYQYNYQDTIVV